MRPGGQKGGAGPGTPPAVIVEPKATSKLIVTMLRIMSFFIGTPRRVNFYPRGYAGSSQKHSRKESFYGFQKMIVLLIRFAGQKGICFNKRFAVLRGKQNSAKNFKRRISASSSLYRSENDMTAHRAAALHARLRPVKILKTEICNQLLPPLNRVCCFYICASISFLISSPPG